MFKEKVQEYGLIIKCKVIFKYKAYVYRLILYLRIWFDISFKLKNLKMDFKANSKAKVYGWCLRTF